MCVIMLVQDQRPSIRIVDQAFDKNGDGGGVAWREGHGKDAVVRWKKGLDRDEMQEMARELPLPYVMHFRLRSVGDDRKALCHPFPVAKDSSTALEGSTKGYVFFHNGTWHKWDDFLLEAAMKTGIKIPVGKWSDTRAMAWLSSFLGFGFLEIIDAKGIAFGPDKGDLEIFAGNGWVKVDTILMSNSVFIDHKVGVGSYNQGASSNLLYGRGRATHELGPAASAIAEKNDADSKKQERIYCRDSRCTKKDGLDSDGFCTEHTKKKELNTGTDRSSLKNGDGKALLTEAEKSEKRARSDHRSPNKPSPFQETVDESREVAQTKGPFLALKLIEERYEEKRLSRSQLKKLRDEFGRLTRSLEKIRVQNLLTTKPGLVLPVD